MTEREKIIKGLLCIKGDYIPCATCKYATADGYGRGDRCKRQCASDVLALLKEQEPILLENQHKPYGISTNANSPWISRCPRCGKKVEGKQTKFCKYCGQAVKWE